MVRSADKEGIMKDKDTGGLVIVVILLAVIFIFLNLTT